MHTMSRISTIGIMFDVVDVETFPKLKDMPYTWVGESFDPDSDIGEWLVIATDPDRVRYFDDDNEALDETNFEAIFGDRANIESIWWRYRGIREDSTMEGVEDAIEAGFATFGRVIIAPPDVDPELLDSWVGYRKSLSDYPILDEMAHSEREHEAWCRWASTGGLQLDTIRELTSDGWDPDVIARIDAQWDHVWPNMSRWLDYYYGFSGESSSVPEAITRAMSEGDIVLNYVEAVDVEDYVS